MTKGYKAPLANGDIREAELQVAGKTLRLISLLFYGLFFLLGSYVVFTWRPASLDFTDSKSQAGFRELVMQQGGLQASQFLTIGLPDPGSIGSETEKLDRTKLCALLFEDSNSPRAGRGDSPVRVATFFDYRCTHCRKLTKILSELQNSGKVQISYKEWPVLGDSSILAARAALAAAKQGQYTAFHNRLMESRFVPTPLHVEALAKELNVNVPRLRRDMNGTDISAALHRSSSLASALNFSGTPALVVGRTIVRGAITRAQLEKLIEIEAGSVLKHPC